MSRRTLALLDGAGAIALVGWWCAALVPLLSTAASDVRVMGAFQTDEVVQVNLLATAILDHTFTINWGNYPHLYFNLALVPLRALTLFRPATEEDIAVVLRFISVLSGAATLGLVFVWARRDYGRLAAWFALAALALNPMPFTWAMYAHPDLLQLFFLLLGLFYSASYCERPTRARLLLASAAAGLAFASKYGGVAVLALLWPIVLWRGPAQDPTAWSSRRFRAGAAMLAAALIAASVWVDLPRVASFVTDDGRIDLPSPERLIAAGRWASGALGLVLFAVVLWPACWTALQRRPRVRAVLRAVAESTAVFAVAFAVASPFSFLRLAVVKGLAFHVLREGFRSQVVTTQWLAFFGDNLGVWIPLMAAAGAACMLLDIVRSRSCSGTDVVLLSWTTVFTVILVLPAHAIAAHYVLPMIPPLIMIAARGLAAGAALLRPRLRGVRRQAAAALLGLIVALVLAPHASRLRAARADALTRERTSSAIRAGEWLLCHVPPTATVAYDYLTYVPAVFEAAEPTWSGSLAWLKRIDPDVVIVNHDTTDRFRGNRDAADYYRCIEDGACGFRLVLRRGEVDVYVRPDRVRPVPAGRPGCDGMS